MTSQTESFINCNPIEDAIMKFRADRYITSMLTAQEDYAMAQTDDLKRQPTIREEIERLTNMIISLQRITERRHDFLIDTIEKRTLVLSSIDEMYDDYC